MKKHSILSAVAAVGLLALTGCWQKPTPAVPVGTPGPAEKAGVAMDKAAQDVSDAAKKAAETAKDVTDKAVKKTGEALEKAGEGMQK